VADTASELAHKLAGQAEAVCRHYLPSGRRAGCYWLVGDVDNTPGRSLYVRLHGPTSGRGAAGHWRDYVAPTVMLRLRAGRRCCEGSAASPQHNLSLRGVA